MHLVVLGLNHKTAPVEVREKFAIDPMRQRKSLEQIQKFPGLLEAAILSTCNRSEIYGVLETPGNEPLMNFWESITGEKNASSYIYAYRGKDAARHLFRVAGGLDSLVLGEGQILSQVKDAYRLAKETFAVGTILNTLFQRAIYVGKRVRGETRIAEGAVSVSFAAVKLAEEKIGELKGKKALLFGAGRMARLTAMHLMSLGISYVYVANRHLEKAEALAEEIGGIPIPLAKAFDFATGVDVIVTSTGAPHYVVKAKETKELMKQRKGRPLFLIDIAVPRDIDPAVSGIDGVTLYNIDALEKVVDEHMDERRLEALTAKAIVEEETAAIIDRFRYLPLQPLMATVSHEAERIRGLEVKRSQKKLGDLSKEDWRCINEMTRRIVRKILKTPMMKLYAAAGTEEGVYLGDAMRSLLIPGVGMGGETLEREADYRYARQ